MEKGELEKIASRVEAERDAIEAQGEPITSYVEELEEIVESTSDIGWGYPGALGDLFQSAFGNGGKSRGAIDE